MASKRLMEKRLEAEAAEARAKEKGEEPAAPKKKASSRKKAKTPEEGPRMKLYWGVFNQSMKRVALYDFSQRDAAQQKAEDLSKKTPHFVQKVKEEVKEVE